MTTTEALGILVLLVVVAASFWLGRRLARSKVATIEATSMVLIDRSRQVEDLILSIESLAAEDNKALEAMSERLDRQNRQSLSALAKFDAVMNEAAQLARTVEESAATVAAAASADDTSTENIREVTSTLIETKVSSSMVKTARLNRYLLDSNFADAEFEMQYGEFLALASHHTNTRRWMFDPDAALTASRNRLLVYLQEPFHGESTRKVFSGWVGGFGRLTSKKSDLETLWTSEEARNSVLTELVKPA